MASTGVLIVGTTFLEYKDMRKMLQEHDRKETAEVAEKSIDTTAGKLITFCREFQDVLRNAFVEAEEHGALEIMQEYDMIKFREKWERIRRRLLPIQCA
jgi:23S rRNA C2498 (ribose-2'-O)-methylase RlmM